MKIIKFDNEEEYIKKFIDFPKKLYTKNDLMEDAHTMEVLLRREHPLSSDFKLTKFLVEKSEEVVGRFIITE